MRILAERTFFRPAGTYGDMERGGNPAVALPVLTGERAGVPGVEPAPE
jgi:hypothetical protein